LREGFHHWVLHQMTEPGWCYRVGFSLRDFGDHLKPNLNFHSFSMLFWIFQLLPERI
jgi:hypothetical protein